jgi:hypothetical protein
MTLATMPQKTMHPNRRMYCFWPMGQFSGSRQNTLTTQTLRDQIYILHKRLFETVCTNCADMVHWKTKIVQSFRK